MMTLQYSSKLSDRWKVSRYVTKVNLQDIGVLLLFGGLAGRLVEIPEAYRKEAEEILSEPNLNNCRESNILKLFQDQGILVPEELDEVALFNNSNKIARFTPSEHINLTICPTLDCNFRCIYCYEDHLPGIMPRDIQDRIVKFIETRKPKVKSLSVTWFGGEPLLALSVIKDLSKRFVNIDNGDIKYDATIVTNGWLLNKSVSKLLVDLGVKQCQITLDGPRDVHNSRRPYLIAAPTFDKILNNLSLSDPRLGITVRVNVDKRNIKKIVPEIFDQLDEAGLRGKIGTYFAPVTAYTDVCANTVGSCLFVKETWSKLHTQLQFAAYKRGYGMPVLPKSLPNVCVADNVNSWVFGANGLVYKCWNHVTQPEKAVLNLNTEIETPKMKVNLDSWMNWHIEDLSECCDCKVLPQCMAGCLDLGILKSVKPSRGYCNELKYNLPEMLATYYLSFKQSESAKQLAEKLQKLFPKVVANSDASNNHKTTPLYSK